MPLVPVWVTAHVPGPLPPVPVPVPVAVAVVDPVPVALDDVPPVPVFFAALLHAEPTATNAIKSGNRKRSAIPEA